MFGSKKTVVKDGVEYKVSRFHSLGPPPSTHRGWRRYYRLNKDQRPQKSSRWWADPAKRPKVTEVGFSQPELERIEPSLKKEV